MGSMALRDKRQPPISYRPPVGLRAELRTRIQNSGKTTNAFITAAIFGRDAPRSRPQPRPDVETGARLLAHVAKLNDRLKALEAAGAQGTEECRDVLIAIRSCVMRLLGKESGP